MSKPYFTQVKGNVLMKSVTILRKGVFDIKDAINLVTERLNISRHTVYLYIRQLKQDQE